MTRNLSLLQWFALLRNLSFWQAVWFLFFQNQLSAAEAILLYVIFDVATTVLEVPSGWFSDRVGRRVTLIMAAVFGACSTGLLAFGGSFEAFALAQILMGAHIAFVSGTDSAMLYETLEAEGRADEVEAQELRIWRLMFTGLALSAVTGGALALWSFTLVFVLTCLSFVALFVVALSLREPPRQLAETEQMRLQHLAQEFRHPVLMWIFALWVLMYGFSHIPFVFGQPFIQEALAQVGWDAQAPLVSGAVTSLMMLASLAVSQFAPALRQRIGLAAILLLAFGMQVALAGLLAMTDATWAIALLFLRMVPDSLSRSFILARIQPLLSDDSRATFLSVRSLVGRLLFAGSLAVAAGSASNVGEMSFAEISAILWVYASIGVISLTVLALLARRVAIEPPPAR